MAKGVTIEMVAREAGVSRGTVDRVINQRPHVRQDQREKVLEAIRKLGYQPKQKRARELGITIREKDVCRLGTILPARNPYYLGELRRGIRDAQAQLADYSVEILTEQCSSSPYPGEIIARMEALVEKGASGLVLCAMNSEEIAEKIRSLKEEGIPVVTYDTDIPGSRLFFYGKDVARSGRVAGELMAKYLSPDDRILVGIGSREIEEHAARVDGFVQTMERAGFSPDHIEVIETYNDYTLTNRKLRQALEEQDAAGIFMANHSLTGCMDAVRGMELRHPPLVIYSEMNERVGRYLENGELAFCVTPNTYMTGYQPLILLKEYIQDHRVPEGAELFTSIEIICRENVAEVSES